MHRMMKKVNMKRSSQGDISSHQLTGEKKSSLLHHKIQRIQIVHPIGFGKSWSPQLKWNCPYCSLVVIFNPNCLYTQSSSKMAIHDLVDSQSPQQNELQAIEPNPTKILISNFQYAASFRI